MPTHRIWFGPGRHGGHPLSGRSLADVSTSERSTGMGSRMAALDIRGMKVMETVCCRVGALPTPRKRFCFGGWRGHDGHRGG